MKYLLPLLLVMTLAWGWMGIQRAFPHDIWIAQGAWRNQAGEWCCGAEDCRPLEVGTVHAVEGGYVIVWKKEAALSDAGNEFVPYSEAMPSPDGMYWRCQRPDGTRRCFFAPPQGS